MPRHTSSLLLSDNFRVKVTQLAEDISSNRLRSVEKWYYEYELCTVEFFQGPMPNKEMNTRDKLCIKHTNWDALVIRYARSNLINHRRISLQSRSSGPFLPRRSNGHLETRFYRSPPGQRIQCGLSSNKTSICGWPSAT